MPSSHIKLEILLLSIIIFILLADYTLLLGHPSTRVGLITKNFLRQKRAKNNASSRRLKAATLQHLRQVSSSKLATTETPTIGLKIGPVTMEVYPRAWWISAAQKMRGDSSESG